MREGGRQWLQGLSRIGMYRYCAGVLVLGVAEEVFRSWSVGIFLAVGGVRCFCGMKPSRGRMLPSTLAGAFGEKFVDLFRDVRANMPTLLHAPEMRSSLTGPRSGERILLFNL